jgi:hypothetical protein
MLNFAFFVLFGKSCNLYSMLTLLKGLFVNKGAYIFFTIANPFDGGELIIDCYGHLLVLIF